MVLFCVRNHTITGCQNGTILCKKSYHHRVSKWYYSVHEKSYHHRVSKWYYYVHEKSYHHRVSKWYYSVWEIIPSQLVKFELLYLTLHILLSDTFLILISTLCLTAIKWVMAMQNMVIIWISIIFVK